MRIYVDGDVSMALTLSGNANRPIGDSLMYYPQASLFMLYGGR